MHTLHSRRMNKFVKAMMFMGLLQLQADKEHAKSLIFILGIVSIHIHTYAKLYNTYLHI